MQSGREPGDEATPVCYTYCMAVSAAWQSNLRGRCSAEGEGLYKPYGMRLPCFEIRISQEWGAHASLDSNSGQLSMHVPVFQDGKLVCLCPHAWQCYMYNKRQYLLASTV